MAELVYAPGGRQHPPCGCENTDKPAALTSAAIVGAMAVQATLLIVLLLLNQPPQIFIGVPIGILAVDLLLIRLNTAGLRRMIGRAVALWADTDRPTRPGR